MKSAIAPRIFLCLVVAALPLWADETADDPELREKAAELYRLSGLESQSQAVGLQIGRGLEQESAELPADLRAVMQDTVREQFADGAYDERSITIIINAWNEPFANVALAWLQSDLGRRITMLEEQASTPEGIAGLQAFAVVMQDNPPPENRQQLIRRLNNAYGGTDLLVDFALALGVAVGVGVNAVNPEYEQMDLEEVMREVRGDRGAMFAQMDQFAFVYYPYTYRALTDDEIQQYIDFLETEAGQWYVTTILDAYTQPVIDVGMEIGVSIRQHVQETRAKLRDEEL